MVYQLQQWCFHYQGEKKRTLRICKYLGNTDWVGLDTDHARFSQLFKVNDNKSWKLVFRGFPFMGMFD